MDNNKLFTKTTLKQLLNDYFPTNKNSYYSVYNKLDECENALLKIARESANDEAWTIEHISTLITGLLFKEVLKYKSEEKKQIIEQKQSSPPSSFDSFISIKKVT